MKIQHIITVAAAAVALSACVANDPKRSYDKPHDAMPHDHHHHHHHHHHHMADKLNNAAPNAVYDCQNGWTVNTQYFAENQNHPNVVTLSIKEIGMSVSLPQAVSASGTRYAGKGLFGTNHQTEWHEKADEAVFDFVTTNKKQASTVCKKIG